MPLSDNKRRRLPEQDHRGASAERAGRATSAIFWRPYLERGLTRETFANNECDILLDMPSRLSSAADDDADLPLDLCARLPQRQGTTTSRASTTRGSRTLQDRRLPALGHPRGARAAHGIKNLDRSRSSRSDADLRPENQPWRQVQEVVDGKLDVAGVWGPFAGWVKMMKGEPLTLQPVNLMDDEVPLEFNLAIGVQNTDVVLKFMLDYALMARRTRSRQILTDYGVPLVQCSDCVVAGDLPRTAPTTRRVAKKYEERFLKPAAARRQRPPRRPTRSSRRAARGLARGRRRRQRRADQRGAGLRHRACRSSCSSKGADVNKRNDQGYAPLHTAARSRTSRPRRAPARSTAPIRTCPTATA